MKLHFSNPRRKPPKPRQVALRLPLNRTLHWAFLSLFMDMLDWQVKDTMGQWRNLNQTIDRAPGFDEYVLIPPYWGPMERLDVLTEITHFKFSPVFKSHVYSRQGEPFFHRNCDEHPMGWLARHGSGAMDRWIRLNRQFDDDERRLGDLVRRDMWSSRFWAASAFNPRVIIESSEVGGAMRPPVTSPPLPPTAILTPAPLIRRNWK